MAELTSSFDAEWSRQICRLWGIHPPCLTDYPQETVTISSRTIAAQLNKWGVSTLDRSTVGMLPGLVCIQPPAAGLPALTTTLASQAVLAREWDSPEEAEAWAYLQEAK